MLRGMFLDVFGYGKSLFEMFKDREKKQYTHDYLSTFSRNSDNFFPCMLNFVGQMKTQ